MDVNYYNILNVNSNVDEKQIKIAYHKLILKFHPDKYPNNISCNEKKIREEQFIKINEAWDILRDPEKRKIYDKNGIKGLDELNKKKKHEENLNEAKERNKKNKADREKRKLQKEEEKIKKEQEEKIRREKEEQIKREREELEKKEKEELKKKEIERLRKKKLEAEIREKELAEKRQREIEQEYKIKNDEKILNIRKKMERIEFKITNKKNYLNKYLCDSIEPFKNLIESIRNIDIIDENSYICNQIINKFTDIIIEKEESIIKELYLKLKKIKEYFDVEFDDPMNKKNIRGKLMLKQFINLSNDYFIDNYLILQYEQFLKKNNLYDTNNFLFLKKITNVYIIIIEHIIPDIYFI